MKLIPKTQFREQQLIEQFEQEFAKFVGTKYAVSVNSGFSALLVALKAHDIGHGDEVIIPDYTFIATATAVSLAGATPVFVDVKEDATINPELIEQKITIRTKAIIPVHLYARRCDMQAIGRIARRHRLKIIEDCAEAIGTPVIGLLAGCWSFHFAKTISTEQGGMITTDDKKFANRCRDLIGYAKDPKNPYLHKEIAYNFRMTSMQADKGLRHLLHLPTILKRKKFLGDKLSLHYKEKPQDAYWVFVSKNLEQWDRGGFVPMHLQPPYRCLGNFPISERLSKELKFIFL